MIDRCCEWGSPLRSRPVQEWSKALHGHSKSGGSALVSFIQFNLLQACVDRHRRAGSFNSPKLLMLSGIGDSKALKKVGVQSIVHLPAVGLSGLKFTSTFHSLRSKGKTCLIMCFSLTREYMLVPVVVAQYALFRYYVNSNATFETLLNASVIDAQVAQWLATHRGPLSQTTTNSIAWLRLLDSDPIFKKYQDPSSGPTSAHYEFIFSVSVIQTQKERFHLSF
jgi:hypothetical protein